MEKISEFLKQFGFLVIIGMVGAGILIYGLWGVLGQRETMVEIIKAGEVTSNLAASNIGDQVAQIVVDVAGAVERPGVYKLPSGGRVGDALVLAGGLAASADREWVARTVAFGRRPACAGRPKGYFRAREIGVVKLRCKVYWCIFTGLGRLEKDQREGIDGLEGLGYILVHRSK